MMLRQAIRTWHRFWFIDIDPFILEVYRVALGLFLVLYYLLLAPVWLTSYGPAAIAPQAIRSLSEFRLSQPSPLLYIPTTWGAIAFYAVSFSSAIALTVGRWGRWPLIWLWVSNVSIMYRNVWTASAEEQVLAILLFYSLWLPLERRTRPQGPVTVWALRLLQVHFAWIYAVSFPWKLILEPAWRDGTIVYYAVQSIFYATWPGGLGLFSWADGLVSRVVTYLVLGCELGFALLVWRRPCRVPLTLMLMALHGAFALFLGGLWMFNLAMIVALILFLPSPVQQPNVGIP